MGYFGSSFPDGNRDLVESVNVIVNSSGQKLHAYDEKVGRDRVPLSDAPSGVEEISLTPINQNRYKRGRNARHKEGGEFRRDVKEIKILSNEGPLQSVKSLLLVNLKDHIGFLPFYLLEVTDNLLNNNSIIKSYSIGKETILITTNDSGKKGL